MTTGRDDGESSGSDSEPSADNLDEEEMEKVLPIKTKPQTVPKPVVKKPEKIAKPLPPPPKPKSPPPIKRQAIKDIVYKSPVKKVQNNYNYDRHNMRKRKPEMKDAWT
jgi:hypothetical protein